MLILSRSGTYDSTREPTPQFSPVIVTSLTKDRRTDTTAEKAQRKKRNGKEKKGESNSEIPYPSLRTPSLIIPTLVFLINYRIVSGKDSLPVKSFVDTLLDLALAILIAYPKPFLLSNGPFLDAPYFLSTSLPLTPDRFPIFPHRLWISALHYPHSLNRCSRLRLPSPHHQHVSESTLNLPSREGAIVAWPGRSLYNWLVVFCRSFGDLPRPSASTWSLGG